MFQFWKKDKCDELISMSKDEKKNFLSNDLIERMIKVEQRVFLSLGEHIPYNKTKYYLSLNGNEKKRFENYLKSKKIKNKIWIVSFFSLLASFIFIRTSFTGNAINDSFGSDAYLLVSEIFVTLILIGFFVGLMIFISRKNKERNFESYFKILDNLRIKRILNRENKKW